MYELKSRDHKHPINFSFVDVQIAFINVLQKNLITGAVTSKGNSEEQTIRLTHTHSHPPEKFSPYELDDSLKQEIDSETMKIESIENYKFK